MSVNIIIYEEDLSLTHLLTIFFESKGHNVRSAKDIDNCLLYNPGSNICSTEAPCADVLIFITQPVRLSNSGHFLEKIQKNCKILLKHKAIMSSNLTKEQEQNLRDSGFYIIKIPFKFSVVETWLNALDTDKSGSTT